MIRVNFCYDITSSYDPGAAIDPFRPVVSLREFVRLSRRAILFLILNGEHHADQADTHYRIGAASQAGGFLAGSRLSIGSRSAIAMSSSRVLKQSQSCT
ncbi:hypothetical protein [Bradyrhizobium elkanii]|uniref:Uncharacterized protein n=1 Tax=Bradyrhizobium elkanii TaxID=29448 RepID=A0A8I2C3S6_BRAEL|nr:hypothetical protein [Bradyrhizobium elkanii]MBP1296885.1 hypothetical protein [Bradyrhizobium elkanii]